MLPVPTTDDLALFSGRAATSYTPYADQALTQSALMFSMATGLQDWPADPDLKQVAVNAVLEMADRLVLEQPYQQVKGSPFLSESIGSYSYSRAQRNGSGVKPSESGTGLYWWDLALDLLSQQDVAVTASGSIAIHTDGLQNRLGDDRMAVQDPENYYGLDRPPYIRIS